MLGKIDVITGPMFSGKSEELIRRLNKIKISGREIRIFKPYIDIRTDNAIESRSGFVLPAIVLTDDQLEWEWKVYPEKLSRIGIHTLAFDEAQFFKPFPLILFIKSVQSKGINILVSGLDIDFARNTFGAMGDLLAIANSVTKLTAVCHNCGKDAPYTYRKGGDITQIVVGDTEIYEAACGECYER